MPLPEEPKFLHFQELVDQARLMIQTYCPEWTDYNVSDPGITLIELFAFMTTQLNYRLNRVPERNYLKFLEMVGVPPEPPEPAKTNVTFYLATPFPLVRAEGELDYTITTRVPVNTEVATGRATGKDEEIIFITEKEQIVEGPRLVHVRRDPKGRDYGNHFDHNYMEPHQGKDGETYKLEPEGVYPFQKETPQEGDAFYLGFDPDYNLEGYVLRLDVTCIDKGVGINPEMPPLVWECSVPYGQKWETILPETDTTKGFNKNGQIILNLPPKIRPISVRKKMDEEAYWIRCRLQRTRPGQPVYTKSPYITAIRAFVLGITIPATQSAIIPQREILGKSNGEPGQKFSFKHDNVLPLDFDRDEKIEVEETRVDGSQFFETWECVESFAFSNRFDRHYMLDTRTGEICFGPAVRQANGEVSQYGAVPKLGSTIRVSQYRIGGGAKGNIPPQTLRLLKKPVSYVSEVTNQAKAQDGKDAEPLEATILRAQEKLRGQQRAVTARDYELLCARYEGLARVRCLEPEHSREPGRIKLLIVPKIEAEEDEGSKAAEGSALSKDGGSNQPDKDSGFLAKLRLSPRLKRRLKDHLESYRILGINLDIKEPTYLAIKLSFTALCNSRTNSDEIKAEIIRRLKRVITPVSQSEWSQTQSSKYLPDERRRMQSNLNGNKLEQFEQGWPFGRKLYLSDIYGLVGAVPGVEYVTGVSLYWYQPKLGVHTNIGPDAWHEAENGVIRVPEDGLIYLHDYDEIKVMAGD